MNEQKQYVCPWCGGKDVVEGIQSTYAKVQPNKALTLKGENLIHVICKNCGTVVRSYVENPQVLRTGGQASGRDAVHGQNERAAVAR